MATSGSYNFSLNRDQLIKRAFQLINVYDINATPSSDDVSYANDVLNMMLLFWSSQGIRLWNRRIGYLFPALNTESYSISATGDHATTAYKESELSAAAASGATTITVDSATGMAANDNVGIELDDGTRQWTTISSISSATLTLAAGLSGAAAVDNTVITYTSKMTRPLRIIRGTTLDLKNSNVETTMQKIGHDEYFDLPDKATAGTANNFYYDPQLSAGKLYLFPRPNNVNDIITFTFYEQLEDLDNATDDIDVPQEWLLPITWNLAVELAYAYGEFPVLQMIEPRAKEMFELVKYYDSEDASIRLGLQE